jgi:hypothetical protein
MFTSVEFSSPLLLFIKVMVNRLMLYHAWTFISALGDKRLFPSSGYQARRLWIANYTLCVILYELTSVLGKGCLHTAIRSTILSFPPSYILLVQYSGKFSWGPVFTDGRSPKFCGLIFADPCKHAHYTLYNHSYFAGLIFTDSRSSTKIGPHENFFALWYYGLRAWHFPFHHKQFVARTLSQGVVHKGGML